MALNEAEGRRGPKSGSVFYVVLGINLGPGLRPEAFAFPGPLRGQAAPGTASGSRIRLLMAAKTNQAGEKKAREPQGQQAKAQGLEDRAAGR
jgi:hypothetical protein